MMIHFGGQDSFMPSVCDQTLTFTSTKAVAAVVEKLIFEGSYGLYHATCEGESRRCDFVRKIFQIMKIECELEEVESSYFNPKYEQPVYSVLENGGLKSLGIEMPHWEEALQQYLEERANG